MRLSRTGQPSPHELVVAGVSLAFLEVSQPTRLLYTHCT